MSSDSLAIDRAEASLGKIYVRVITGVELEAVLFGIFSTAIVSKLYTSFRRAGIRTYFTRKRASSSARLGASILLYALFTCHWVFSVKYSQDFMALWDSRDLFQGFTTAVDPSYVPLLAESVLFGVFCALVALAVYVLVRKGLGARSQQAMLAAVLFMYAVSLTHWVLQMITLQSANVPYRESVLVKTTVPFVLLSLNVVLSDAIVLWRMCVLCNQHSFARSLALFLLLSTIGLTAATFAAEVPLFTDGGGGDASSFSTTTFGIAVLGLSLATNVVATSIIGWRVWRYRKDISAHLGSFNHRSIVEKIMTLLVESGCVYCVFWILYMIDTVGIGQINGATGPIAFGIGDPEWSSRFMPQLTGIYPTVIIVIVALEQSYMENAFSESKLSTFVVARPITTQPRSHSRSRGSIMSWRPSRSVGRDTRDIRLESISLDAQAAAVADAGEADGISPVSTVEDKGSRARTAQRATQGGFESLHSVHVEPRTAHIQNLELRSSTVQGGSASCHVVLEPHRAHPSSSSSLSSTARALTVDRPQQASYLSTPDYGASVLVHAQAYDIRKTSEDTEHEDECIPASMGTNRRAPPHARRSV